MTPAEPPERPFADLPEADPEPRRRRISSVWLLPAVAALAGLWMVVELVGDSGPLVSIRFDTAEGIDAGTTRVKFRDVEVGQVETVRFSPDLTEVVVEARLDPGMEPHLTADTRFWVVRPRVGATGVSGLDTLISGAYVAMDPGTAEGGERSFDGLETPPIVTSDVAGTRYRLQADGLGSLTVGAPVYFRQIPVGEVIRTALSADHERVDVDVFVRAPHDAAIREGSRFWNATGFELDVGPEGVSLAVESLVALLAGGVAFETPDRIEPDARAAAGATFTLHANRAAALAEPGGRKYPYLLYFSETVRGLRVGAPVEFRGIRIGEVAEIAVDSDLDARDLRIPVLVDLEPGRLSPGAPPGSDTDPAASQRELMAGLVARGLRARLQTANLLTGQLFVELDIYPDAPPAELDAQGRYPRLPTMPSPLSGITASLGSLLGRLEQLPVEAIGANLEGATGAAERLLTDPRLADTIGAIAEASADLRRLAAALEREAPPAAASLRAASGGVEDLVAQASAATARAEDAFAAVEELASGRSVTGARLQQALTELEAAARSLRLLAELLQRRPDALLRGR